MRNHVLQSKMSVLHTATENKFLDSEILGTYLRFHLFPSSPFSFKKTANPRLFLLFETLLLIALSGTQNMFNTTPYAEA